MAVGLGSSWVTAVAVSAAGCGRAKAGMAVGIVVGVAGTTAIAGSVGATRLGAVGNGVSVHDCLDSLFDLLARERVRNSRDSNDLVGNVAR